MMQLHYTPNIIYITGTIPLTVPHAHHALQLTVARSGVLVDQTQHRSVLIDADTPHSLSAGDAVTLLIDPETHCAQILRARFLNSAPLCTGLPVEIRADVSAQALLAQLVPARCLKRHLDPRIQDVFTWLDTMQANGCWSDVSLAAALERAHLSESRFLHLFKEQTGIPWRPALIWRRAQVAMQYASRGWSLTDAAHMAGYADSAHLSRQFKSLFGLSPSVVLENSRFVQVPEADGS